MKENPIGVFDSGIGGLSVVKEIIKGLPYENIIYFGDTARVPYGTKSNQIVKKFASDDVEFLLKFNPKVIIIACHTVSSIAGDYLRKKYKEIKFIDVVNPSVEKAIKITENKKIGVIGTTATISSAKYKKLLEKYEGIKVYMKACPVFVPIVEEGWFDNEITYKIVDFYLKDFKKSGIDTLILGCTHYPYLKKAIERFLGEKIKIVDASFEVVVKLKKILTEDNLVREKGDGKIELFFSDISPHIKKAISILFKKNIKYKLANV